MANMKLTPDEQEVSIIFDNESDIAKLYTSIPKWIRKMDKMCEENPEVFKCTGRDEVSAKYEFPKKNVSIRKGNPEIKLSEEEKERRRKNMMNNMKKEKDTDNESSIA